MYQVLKKISARPVPYEFYTTKRLWNDPHISKKMLEYHLNESADLSSKNMEFVKKSVEWIADKFGVKKRTEICDFGCGPGLYTSRLAKLGASVTGIDFSKRSIQFAKEEAVNLNLNINYVNKNYLYYSTDEQFDLITLLFCDFCALLPQQRKKLLGIFRKNLKDGGSVLMDVCSLKAFEEIEEMSTCRYGLMDGFWTEENYYGFLNIFKYKSEKLILDKYTIIEKKRIWNVYNWLQYYSIEMLEKELKESGLRIKEYYADISGGRYGEESTEICVIIGK